MMWLAVDHRPMDEAGLDAEGLAHLLRWVQDGVVSRRQLKELGARDFDIARMVRRRELTVVHPGVYVEHTGPLSWNQRAWAGVLAHWPAALARESALPNPRRTGLIQLAVGPRRSVKPVAGTRVRRCARFDERVQWRQSPPRIAPEHAVLDVAGATTDRLAKYHVIAEACQTRETWPEKILDALATRQRVKDREFLVALLGDLATGACSVLEREYLDLERRHGLPVEDRRQRPATVNGRRAYRDVDHRDYGLLVELDGKGFHDNPRAWDRDAERDLDAAVTVEARTVRLTYGQVLSNGCRTIGKIAILLGRGGWSGPFIQCPQCAGS